MIKYKYIPIRFLPLAEVIMCSGFFFISGLEELLHHFLHPHQIPEKDLQMKMNSMKETSYTNGTNLKTGKHNHSHYRTKISGFITNFRQSRRGWTRIIQDSSPSEGSNKNSVCCLGPVFSQHYRGWDAIVKLIYNIPTLRPCPEPGVRVRGSVAQHRGHGLTQVCHLLLCRGGANL